MRTGGCKLFRRELAGLLRAIAEALDPPAPARSDFFTRRLEVARAQARVYDAEHALEVARDRLGEVR